MQGMNAREWCPPLSREIIRVWMEKKIMDITTSGDESCLTQMKSMWRQQIIEIISLTLEIE